jgi:hypothetical protein
VIHALVEILFTTFARSDAQRHSVSRTEALPDIHRVNWHNVFLRVILFRLWGVKFDTFRHSLSFAAEIGVIAVLGLHVFIHMLGRIMLLQWLGCENSHWYFSLHLRLHFYTLQSDDVVYILFFLLLQQLNGAILDIN